MAILDVVDFRTYFLDRVFTDVIDKKLTYPEAVKITNESGVFFSGSQEATSVLNSLERNSAAPTYADMVGSNAVTSPDYSLIKTYTTEQSAAVTEIHITRNSNTKAGYHVVITYRSNGTAYSYNVATLEDVQIMYNNLIKGVASVGSYVHSLRNTKILTPYRLGK